MRSIGKVNIRKLKKICEEECREARNTLVDIGGIAWLRAKNAIEERVPIKWYQSWEMAPQEINRLIDDFINQIRYKR